jgi:ABC-type multidrug transport system ATPase subunit
MSQVFIEIKELRKHYFHHKKLVKKALNGVSFQIFEGEVFGLLGVNGAGKTTLSTILASLHPPTEGSVLWNGVSIYDNIIDYRRNLGFCPQHPNLDKTLTLEENLLFAGRYYLLGGKEIKERAKELMELLHLKSYAESLVSHLSGGYRQRFLIARALMHRPKFVILDEPTVGLDPQIRRELWQIILSLKKQGATVLLTTHYLDEAEAISDRVCIIDRGEIRVIDTPANLNQLYQKGKLEDVFLHLMQEPESI